MGNRFGAHPVWKAFAFGDFQYQQETVNFMRELREVLVAGNTAEDQRFRP